MDGAKDKSQSQSPKTPPKMTDADRLKLVEKNLDQAIGKMNGIDASLLALTSKLDAVFGKVMGFPATPLNVRIASEHNEEERESAHLDVMLEDEIDEHQKMLLASEESGEYDDIEVQSEAFAVVEKEAIPVVINDSDSWRINPKNRCVCLLFCLFGP
jgi:hypothetical protein